MTLFEGAILSIISKAKSEGIDANEYFNIYRDDFKRKDVATIYLAYEEELKRQNLVVRTKEKKKRKNLRYEYNRGFFLGFR